MAAAKKTAKAPAKEKAAAPKTRALPKIETPDEAKKAPKPLPEFAWPEPDALGNDWAPFRLGLRFRVKQLEGAHSVDGLEAKRRDHVVYAFNADGSLNGRALLTPDELADHYEPGR